MARPRKERRGEMAKIREIGKHERGSWRRGWEGGRGRKGKK